MRVEVEEEPEEEESIGIAEVLACVTNLRSSSLDLEAVFGVSGSFCCCCCC